MLRQLLKDSSFVLSSNIVLLVVSIGTGMVVARVLGPEGKGQFHLALQFVSILGLLFSMGLGASYQFHIRKEIFSRKAIADHFAVFMAVVIILLSLIVLFGLDSLHLVTANAFDDEVMVAVIGLIILNTFALNAAGILMAEPDGVKVASLFGVMSGLTYLLLIVGLIAFAGYGVMGALFSFGLALIVKTSAAAKVVAVAVLAKGEALYFGVSKKVFSYGFFALIGNLMMAGLLRFDFFAINIYLDLVSVGIYSVSVAMAELMLLVPTAIGVALFPSLTSASVHDQLSAMCLVARLSTVLGVLSAIVLAALSQTFIVLLFGAQFESAYIPLLFLLPGLVAFTVVYSYANFFSSRGQPSINALVFASCLLVNIALNITLIPDYGLNGAAIASSVAYVIAAISFTTIVLVRERSITLFHLLPRFSDIQYLLHELKIVLSKGAKR
jgi:O-antigen/teichoic acid export membrane protein